MIYIILLFSISFNKNFPYKSEDWYTISNPGSIKSITSSRDEIYFCTDKGIYIYNLNDESFSFDEEYIRDFDSGKSLIIHYDEYRDYLWYLSNNYLHYKPRISSFWRKIDFYQLNINSYRTIRNIGSDHNNLYLDLGQTIAVLDPITGKFIELADSEYNAYNANWSSSEYNLSLSDIDLSRYFSFDGYNIIANNKIEHNNRVIYLTTVLKDKFNDYWIGTDSGEIFYCDSKMKLINKIDSIPLISNINLSYIDDIGDWWISTNDYILISDKSLIFNYPIFITQWKEYENKWINYSKNEFSYIESKDITSLSKIDHWLYIGTSKGLLIFNIKDNKWDLIDESDGLHSNLIYDIVYSNNNLYIATALGINVVNTIGNFIIDPPIFDHLDNFSIYDINSQNDKLFFATEVGLFEYNYKINIINQVIEEKYLKVLIDSNDNFILSKRNKLYRLKNKREILFSGEKIKNISICNDFIWINNINHVSILNVKNNKYVEYNYSDGIIGDRINHLDCDDSWVWFSTNKGISMYNWSKYHYHEK
tara:strand:+ start:326 stop:1930 length:1605 start_codon:yes stop_codon:yes gene_type:complete